ncbi:MAG TPA: outer membrane lipoprotein-sorting protein [Candidatus Acidoferrales bacterium]|nr:outer membrane lipoprotein-sorting protein [Candidatus Acidoferrales bacterium]
MKFGKQVGIGLFLLGLVTLPSGRVAAESNEGHDLMKRVLDAAPKAPFKAHGKITSDRGWDREVTLIRANQEGMEKIYLEVTSPTDLKDTRFLLLDRLEGADEQYMFVPQLKRSIQLNMETRKQDFLGTDFAVADLVRPELEAFNYTVVGEETLDGRPCKLVQAVPKNPAEQMYSKTVTAIDPKDNVIIRTLMFDDKGAPLKTWTIDKYDKVDGNLTPVVQRMVNVRNGHWSKIEMVDMQYNAQLPAEVFNKSYLIR